MSEINQKAWDILTDDEQLALTLKHGHNKSSWEAGEIVGRAHYKFLEIESRAKQFLKIFTEHFQFYDEIIPPYLPIDKRVLKYFKETIAKRRDIKDAVDLINDDTFSVRAFRERLIIEAMEQLTNSKDVILKNVALLIFDFDRWNNFRILPTEIQEPSAFKRRNKNADKRNIANILKLHTFITEQIVKRYHRPSIKTKEKVVFVPVFSKFIKPEKSILVVRYNEQNIEELSKIGLYVFPREEKAKEFFDLVATYDPVPGTKDCKFGQKFWPQFRLLIKQSLNYNNIQKRIPSRKFLESALVDLDIKLVKPKEKDYTPEPIKNNSKRVRKSENLI